jgi:PIN domain nuclease of toxin-antitoxin system
VRLLFDTHALVWWASDQSKLSAVALAHLTDPANELWLSAASVWELQIKLALGKFTLVHPLDVTVQQQTANGVGLLPITVDHVLALRHLPPIHKDPFDRILVAQALAEGASLVTSDAVLSRYPAPVVW